MFNGICFSEVVFYIDLCKDSVVVLWSDLVVIDNLGIIVMMYFLV